MRALLSVSDKTGITEFGQKLVYNGYELFSTGGTLKALEDDHEFLTKGGVFTKEMLDAYIALKKEEVERYNVSVHPIEFDMYYSC